MTRRQGNLALLAAFAVLAVGSMLLTGVFDYLMAPDKRQLVVTLVQGADQAERVALKQACGHLPGIGVVPDKGNPDPAVQGRFPVRFSLRGASFAQEAALESCINAQPHIRGFLVEGDN